MGRDDLAAVYPGRFTQYKPAAVELQTTLALFEGMPSRLHLTPDTAPERDDLPVAETLAGQLLLADRGYFRWDYLNRLDDNGASFVMRAYTTINPWVVQAFDGRGKRRPRLEGRPLKAASHASSCPGFGCLSNAKTTIGRVSAHRELEAGSKSALYPHHQSGPVTL